jgi:hypothetical protein
VSSSISGDLGGESRILLESMGREIEAVLRPGQRLTARVIEMLLTGDVLLDLGASKAVVRANGPLQPGERVVLEVVSGGATPELRIATGKTPVTAVTPQTATAQPATVQPATVQPATAQGATVQPSGVAGSPAGLNPRDLPVIMQALAELPPAALPIAEAGHTFVRAAVAAELRPAVVEQIQHLLAPLQAALPPAELAPVLRAFLAQSGLFTENHLSAVLREHPGPLTADQRHADPRHPDQRHAIADVRVLLGALTTAGTPVPEPVRVFGEALLQQQLLVAEQLAATGGGQVAIPFMFGEEPVDIRFTWDRQPRQETQGRSEPEDDQAISLGVFVNVNIFGAIEARIVWKPASFAVTFYVEREATRAIVEAGLSDLSKELSASGFPAVATNVWLNPDRVAAGATPVRPAIPAGTILDVMA